MSLNDPLEPEKSLTAKQLAAIPMLASGRTIEATAKDIKVNEKTIDRWKHEAPFRDALRDAENAMFDEALNLLKKAARPAINCLLRNMDGKVSAYVQVQAASKLLEQAMEVHKVQELEQRLAELEERLREH